jgi:Protein of unknown function (DUF1236)
MLALSRFCHNVGRRVAPLQQSALRLPRGARNPDRGTALGHRLAKTGAFVMRPIGTISAGLTLTCLSISVALVSGAAVAQAQTAVTRQITSEPVETVITQGPNGTAVTRRILTPEPGISTIESEPQYVEPAAPRLAPRRVTGTTVGQAPARPRTATVRERPQPARSATRTVTVAAPPPISDQALLLSPAQRQIIYRGVVQREYYPVPVPAGPPVGAQTDVYAPPPASGYPLRTVYPADERYGEYAYDPYHDDYREPYRPAYRRDNVSLVVGARIPQSVPLYAVPEPVAARIPAATPYGYALIDNRVFLVDPATGVIVADITQ